MRGEFNSSFGSSTTYGTEAKALSQQFDGQRAGQQHSDEQSGQVDVFENTGMGKAHAFLLAREVTDGQLVGETRGTLTADQLKALYEASGSAEEFLKAVALSDPMRGAVKIVTQQPGEEGPPTWELIQVDDAIASSPLAQTLKPYVQGGHLPGTMRDGQPSATTFSAQGRDKHQIFRELLGVVDPNALVGQTVAVGNGAGQTVTGTIGDDVVLVPAATVAESTVTTGLGNDHVLAVDATLAGVTIDTQENDDAIQVTGTIEDSKVLAGSGDDALVFHGLITGSEIQGEEGRDRLAVAGKVRGTKVHGGDGDDTLTVAGEVFDSRIDGGAGTDAIVLDAKIVGSVIRGGSGDDAIVVGGELADSFVELGNGSDTVVITDTARGKLVVDDTKRSSIAHDGKNLKDHDALLLVGEGWRQVDKRHYQRLDGAGNVLMEVELKGDREHIELIHSTTGKVFQQIDPEVREGPLFGQILKIVTPALALASTIVGGPAGAVLGLLSKGAGAIQSLSSGSPLGAAAAFFTGSGAVGGLLGATSKVSLLSAIGGGISAGQGLASGTASGALGALSFVAGQGGLGEASLSLSAASQIANSVESGSFTVADALGLVNTGVNLGKEVGRQSQQGRPMLQVGEFDEGSQRLLQALLGGLVEVRPGETATPTHPTTGQPWVETFRTDAERQAYIEGWKQSFGEGTTHDPATNTVTDPTGKVWALPRLEVEIEAPPISGGTGTTTLIGGGGKGLPGSEDAISYVHGAAAQLGISGERAARIGERAAVILEKASSSGTLDEAQAELLASVSELSPSELQFLVFRLSEEAKSSEGYAEGLADLWIELRRDGSENGLKRLTEAFNARYEAGWIDHTHLEKLLAAGAQTEPIPRGVGADPRSFVDALAVDAGPVLRRDVAMVLLRLGTEQVPDRWKANYFDAVTSLTANNAALTHAVVQRLATEPEQLAQFFSFGGREPVVSLLGHIAHLQSTSPAVGAKDEVRWVRDYLESGIAGGQLAAQISDRQAQIRELNLDYDDSSTYDSAVVLPTLLFPPNRTHLESLARAYGLERPLLFGVAASELDFDHNQVDFLQDGTVRLFPYVGNLWPGGVTLGVGQTHRATLEHFRLYIVSHPELFPSDVIARVNAFDSSNNNLATFQGSAEAAAIVLVALRSWKVQNQGSNTLGPEDMAAIWGGYRTGVAGFSVNEEGHPILPKDGGFRNGTDFANNIANGGPEGGLPVGVNAHQSRPYFQYFYGLFNRE